MLRQANGLCLHNQLSGVCKVHSALPASINSSGLGTEMTRSRGVRDGIGQTCTVTPDLTWLNPQGVCVMPLLELSPSSSALAALGRTVCQPGTQKPTGGYVSCHFWNCPHHRAPLQNLAEQCAQPGPREHPFTFFATKIKLK